MDFKLTAAKADGSMSAMGIFRQLRLGHFRPLQLAGLTDTDVTQGTDSA
jgi:hypothetical protein